MTDHSKPTVQSEETPARAVSGIHHVTALASDPARNLEVYTGVLGLRLVKKTVNFDDPGTYHLYYGDETGRPGTILTFFPWPGARQGRLGSGQTSATAFAVPTGSLGYWSDRLRRHGLATERPSESFDGEEVLSLLDPDGMRLELVTRDGVEEQPFWSGGGVPDEAAIRGFAGVTLLEAGLEDTATLLTEELGLRRGDERDGRFRFRVGEGADRATVDLVVRPGEERGRIAAGSVHHVAWRVADDRQQLALRDRVGRRMLFPSPVLDRQYFRSVYFREPGGVLFELATDGPGFSVDEPVDGLGRELCLPPWLEKEREHIERSLPALEPQRSGGRVALASGASR